MKNFNFPKGLQHLIPLVKKWGISDDGFRDELVFNSDKDELIILVNSITNEDSILLEEWLCDEKSNTPPFSEEYIAFSCFLMAYEYAKSRIKNLGSSSNKI